MTILQRPWTEGHDGRGVLSRHVQHNRYLPSLQQVESLRWLPLMKNESAGREAFRICAIGKKLYVGGLKVFEKRMTEQALFYLVPINSSFSKQPNGIDSTANLASTSGPATPAEYTTTSSFAPPPFVERCNSPFSISRKAA